MRLQATTLLLTLFPPRLASLLFTDTSVRLQAEPQHRLLPETSADPLADMTPPHPPGPRAQ